MAGTAETYTIQTMDRTMPMTTPAITPAPSTPNSAAMAIQKSERLTRCSRRMPATSIMPITTASMISADRTGVGRSEKTGARNSNVSTTSDPVVNDARGDLAPDWSFRELEERLAETGIPCTRPVPRLDMPCASDSSLVDVDLVAMP